MNLHHPLFITGSVGLGGAVGALFRYIIMESSGDGLGAAATGLLLINVAGCALLAAVLVVGERRFHRHRLRHLWRPVMATGVLGGFTSTSAFAVISLELGGAHGLLYAATSVLLGIGAFAGVQNFAYAVWSTRDGDQ